MQTFLPFSDFKKSAESLDYRRLGKQRVEAMQIIRILDGTTPNVKWKNHPAVKMWEGYLESLKHYTNICINEWIKRGYKNNMKLYEVNDNFENPWWVGNEDLHRAMRSRLIEKSPLYYINQYGEIDKGFNNNKYFWPVNYNRTFRII